MDFGIEPKLIELGNESVDDENILLNSKEISSFEVEENKEKRKDI